MSKKNNEQSNKAAIIATPKEAKIASNYSFEINDKQALLITLVIAAISYVFSNFYTSFYQGEEGAQYMDALAFSHNLKQNPAALMGNWPKTGWKIIYGPIAVLFGKQGVLIVNCLFSAFSGFFAYKLAGKIIEKKTALPFIFLITQTLWFLLAYKFYSEIPTAFLLVLGVYLFYCEKYIVAALTLSYVLLLRQEFVFIMPYFAFILLKKKQWIAFFCLGLFSLAYNFVGYLQTGDLLYSVHESIKYSNLILGSAPRQGFDNFFVMSGAIYNHIVICFVALYLAQVATMQIKKVEWTIVVPAIGFFIIHCLFNVKLDPSDPSFTPFSLNYPSIVISALVIFFAVMMLKQIQKNEQRIAVYAGAFILCFCSFYFKDAVIAFIHKLPTTGGNLRYVLVVSPLLAVLAAKAIDNMQFVEKRNMLLIGLIPFVCLVAGYMTYYHNWIGMNTEGDKDRIPMLLCVLAVVAVLFIKSNAMLMKASAALCLLTVLIYIRPKELCCDENFEQKKISEYVIENKLDKKPIMQSLALMNFFVGRNNWDYPNGCTQMYGDSTLDRAKVGTIIIWDTHYATKYGKVQGAYIEKNMQTGRFKLIKEFRSEDNAFAAVILEKMQP
jgi:hypothetical protein